MTEAIPLRRDRAPVPAPAETVAERVRRLQAEAKALAKDHVNALAQAIADLEQAAAEVVAGGDAYSEGARGVARDVVRSCQSQRTTLAQIVGRG